LPLRIPIRTTSEELPIITAKGFWIDGGTSADLSFIVDTGASDITISEDSAVMLGARLSKLPRLRTSMRGIGGTVGTFELRNLALMFTSDAGIPWQVLLDSVHVYQNLSVNRGGKRELMPSLIGRAFMEEYSMILNWDFGKRIAYLEVRDSMKES
jgi:hypothetical protein